MPDMQLLLLASELRSRAQEVLARAANMGDAQAQDIMRAIAVGYENLARRFELFAASVEHDDIAVSTGGRSGVVSVCVGRRLSTDKPLHPFLGERVWGVHANQLHR